VLFYVVICPSVPCFSLLSDKWNDFRKIIKNTVIEEQKCVLIFSTNFVWNISNSSKNSEIFIINVHRA
jgi:hypothetical protein